ncbi:MAG: hypothetical protein QOH63_3647 [Acidobacteriota bacterium]|nr:hypothetical protein [Acidobacteriota bacterium]
MPAGINAVLMPGDVARILRRLVKNQRAVNQNIATQNILDRIQEGIVRDQMISPIEKQVKAVESLERACFTVACDRLKLAAKKSRLVNRKHSDGEDDTVAVILIELFA